MLQVRPNSSTITSNSSEDHPSKSTDSTKHRPRGCPPATTVPVPMTPPNLFQSERFHITASRIHRVRDMKEVVISVYAPRPMAFDWYISRIEVVLPDQHKTSTSHLSNATRHRTISRSHRASLTLGQIVHITKPSWFTLPNIQSPTRLVIDGFPTRCPPSLQA